MKRSRPNRTSNRLLCWIFERGRDAITCQVDRMGQRGAYMVSIIPHRNLRRAIVEGYAGGAAAFCRHAEIALALRHGGWKVASYSR